MGTDTTIGRGHFSDGLTAARTEVDVAVEAAALVVLGPGRVRRVVWPLLDLRPVDVPGHGAEVTVTCIAAPDARLTLVGEAVVGALLAAAPQVAPKPAGPTGRSLLAWAVGGIVVTTLVLVSLPAITALAARLLPPSVERVWGDQVYAQVRLLLGPEECTETQGFAALERLVGRLAVAAGLEATDPFTIHVLPSSMVNAFALPGGHVVVLDGLLRKAAGPDDVAGVLAHEIAHVARRHVTQRAVRDFGLDLALTATTGSGGMGEIGRSLVALAYSRDDEREADEAAVTILAGAGLKADRLGPFLETMTAGRKTDGGPAHRSDGEGAAGYLTIISTHPATAERIAILGELALAHADTGETALSATEWAALQTICEN